MVLGGGLTWSKLFHFMFACGNGFMLMWRPRNFPDGRSCAQLCSCGLVFEEGFSEQHLF